MHSRSETGQKYTIPVGSTTLRTSNFRCKLDAPLAEPILRGLGGILVIAGDCSHDDQLIEEIRATTNDLVIHTKEIEIYHVESRLGSGMRFRFEILLSNSPLDQITLGLKVRIFEVGWLSIDLGCVSISNEPIFKPSYVEDTDHSPLITVCMATYRPQKEALSRQIQSLRAQTYRNWKCVISDDASGESCTRMIRHVCDGDDRFTILESPVNHGFYQNFERALNNVPPETAYVALCDQDDRWYPDKLGRLLQAFDAKTTLVYSDMRIVDEATDEVISATYWNKRNNNYTDLTVLLVANTITGAAALFRASLLPYLLPFPEKVGDAFHDHWIGCVALSAGNINYIDSPLYDYYQYSENVIGHCDFDTLDVRERGKIIGSWLRKLGRPGELKTGLVKAWLSSLAVYKYECRRIRIISRTITSRIAVADAKKRNALGIFGFGLWPGIKLLGAHPKILLRKQTTDDAELRLAAGYIVFWLNRYRERFILRKWKSTHIRT